jgi:hypothetical protein
MKRFILFAGVAWTVTLTQSVQAVPVHNNDISISGGTVVHVAPTHSLPTLPVGSKVSTRTAPTMTPLLSSVAGALNVAHSTVFEDRNYMPASLVSHYKPSEPQKPAPPAKGAGGPASVPDGGATVGLFGIALLATGLMKRKFAA